MPTVPGGKFSTAQAKISGSFIPNQHDQKATKVHSGANPGPAASQVARDLTVNICAVCCLTDWLPTHGPTSMWQQHTLRAQGHAQRHCAHCHHSLWFASTTLVKRYT